MPDDLGKDLEGGLEKALNAMQEIQTRLEAGEEIDEKEMTMLTRMVAMQIEEVRSRLEAAVGPLDPDKVREEMRKQLSPEEYEEWVATEIDRKKIREELERERAVREQLGE